MNSFDRFCAAPIGAEARLPHVKLSSEAHGALERLPDAEFALPVYGDTARSRRLPMHTPDFAQRSAAYLVESGARDLPASLVKVASDRLIERLRHFGIPVFVELAELNKTSSTHNPSVQTAHTLGRVYWSHFASDWEDHEADSLIRSKLSSAPQPTVRSHLPVLHSFTFEGSKQVVELRNLKDIKEMDEYLSKHSSSLSSNDRRHISRQLLVALEKLSFDTRDPKLLEKFSNTALLYGGSRVRPEAPFLVRSERLDHLEKTSMFLPAFVDEAMLGRIRASYEEVAGSLRKVSSVQEAEGIAAGLDKMDRLINLPDHLMPAHRIVFLGIGERPEDPGAIKVSEDADVIYTGGQTRIREGDLRQIQFVPLAALQNVLGEEVTDELRKDPVTIFKSLPKPHQRMVARFVEETIVINRRSDEDLGLR